MTKAITLHPQVAIIYCQGAQVDTNEVEISRTRKTGPGTAFYIPHGDFTELHQRWFFIRDLQTNKATSKTHSFPIFKLTLEEAEVAIAETAPTNYSGAAFAFFQAATRKQGKQYWGDKTPR